MVIVMKRLRQRTCWKQLRLRQCDYVVTINKGVGVVTVIDPQTGEVVDEIELSEDDRLDIDSATDRLRQCGYIVTE